MFLLEVVHVTLANSQLWNSEVAESMSGAFRCHRGMARPEVQDGGNIYVLRVATNVGTE